MTAAIQARVMNRREGLVKQKTEAESRAAFLATAKGEPGERGAPGPIPEHEWQGTRLRFQKADGQWGKAVDLKGEQGDEGQTRIFVRGGGGGGSGTNLETLLPGANVLEPTGIAVIQGGQWVSLQWPAFISILAGAIDMGVEFSRRSDFVGDSLIYRGEAAPGSAEESAVWRIKRIAFGEAGDVVETWANGSSEFTNVWTDRTQLTYL